MTDAVDAFGVGVAAMRSFSDDPESLYLVKKCRELALGEN